MDLSERGAGATRHPWEIERFRAYRRVLADHGALSATRILDVGAGDGWFSESLLPDLAADTEVYCWDTNYSELELDTDDARIVRSVEPPSGVFDLALLLDVIEHVDDPAALMNEVLRPVLPPGTPVLVAVPAHPALFSSHDVALGHHRRYRRSHLRAEVATLLDIIEEGPLFSTLLAPRAAAVAVERARHGRATAAGSPESIGEAAGIGHWTGGPTLTRSVRAVLAADARVTRWGPMRHLPGLSSWVFGHVTGRAA